MAHKTISPATPRPDSEESRPCPTCKRGRVIPVRMPWGETMWPPRCGACARGLEQDEKAEQARHRVEQMLARSGITARLAPLTLHTYPADNSGQAALDVAGGWLRDYLEHDSRANLLLFGGVGVGKTGLAWGIVRELCERGRSATLVNFRLLLHELREGIRQDAPNTLISRCRRVEVLCLDDLGAERATDFARDSLATLVEYRYGASLPTIVTSNYDPGKLAERLGHDDVTVGQRIVSRLVEGAVQHRMLGPDRRLP